ncbi:MAG: DUF1460 domain-containing protein [Epsilonproteobacteria bacterium]|nr:MAG: DUF1460 domain-containing protein [Campylobacterota bacterium]
MKNIFRFFLLNILILTSLGQVHARSHSQVEELIKNIKNLPTSLKIEKSSASFLGSKTKIGPLGEGTKGRFDQDPLYSFEVFDCTTYVETVMALSLAQDLKHFKRKIVDIRYLDGIISYQRRNHFISLDWIPNNASVLSDITSSIGDVIFAKAIIDKKNWYKKKFASKIIEQMFKSQSSSPQLAEIPYLSLKALLKGPTILKSIPHGSIINVVRPNWDLRDSIGTFLNVSHQGIAIWKKGKLFYRHASSFPDKTVKDTPFKEYFSKYLNSKTLKGINIQELN